MNSPEAAGVLEAPTPLKGPTLPHPQGLNAAGTHPLPATGVCPVQSWASDFTPGQAPLSCKTHTIG